jgi:ABC-type glycerol-3-phosphate transport system permease component
MAKNSSFLCFRAVFMSYYPLFWGSMQIYKEYDSLYILGRNDNKTCCFCVYGPFGELLPTVLGFWGDLQGPWKSVHVWEVWPKTRRFCVLGPFSWAIAHSFGVPEWFTRSMTLSNVWEVWPKTHRFCVLGPFSWAIAHCFWVSVIFTRNMTVCTF